MFLLFEGRERRAPPLIVIRNEGGMREKLEARARACLSSKCVCGNGRTRTSRSQISILRFRPPFLLGSFSPSYSPRPEWMLRQRRSNYSPSRCLLHIGSVAVEGEEGEGGGSDLLFGLNLGSFCPRRETACACVRSSVHPLQGTWAWAREGRVTA